MEAAAPDLPARARAVKERARSLGFDACGIASAKETDPKGNLGKWLDLGYHADMDWMARTREIREDVGLKVPDARSVVVVARNYYSPRPARGEGRGKVAAYAWGRDYHRVLAKPLRELGLWIEGLEVGAACYCSVDSGPVLERTWAERSGVGSVGKNGLSLRRDLGSWFFLATVITTVDLAPDRPAADICGSCTRCLEGCPTSAIVAPGVVDSRRCISYQTIENRGEIPAELGGNLGDWVFGCDICQELCPWNGSVGTTTEEGFLPREGQANPELGALVEMDEKAFNARFEGTPIRRAKHEGMRRNAEQVLENR